MNGDGLGALIYLCRHFRGKLEGIYLTWIEEAHWVTKTEHNSIECGGRWVDDGENNGHTHFHTTGTMEEHKGTAPVLFLLIPNPTPALPVTHLDLFARIN